MYIEFAILDNFLLTFLAGRTAAKLSHNKANIWRLIASATVGTVVAVFYPYLREGIVVELAVKLSLWVVLCAIMYYKTPRFAVQSLMFLGCTFAFGGASYALGLILYSSATRAAEFSSKYPLFLVLGTGGAVYAGAAFCIKKMRVPSARAPYEYGLQVKVYGASMNFRAFMDTGNCVFDEKTGLPVVVTDVDSFTKKLDGTAAVEFAKQLSSLRTISARTHAGETSIYVLRPTEISVYSDRQWHKIHAMIGLVGGERRFSKEHEMLLNPAVLEVVV